MEDFIGDRFPGNVCGFWVCMELICLKMRCVTLERHSKDAFRNLKSHTKRTTIWKVIAHSKPQMERGKKDTQMPPKYHLYRYDACVKRTLTQTMANILGRLSYIMAMPTNCCLCASILHIYLFFHLHLWPFLLLTLQTTTKPLNGLHSLSVVSIGIKIKSK